MSTSSPIIQRKRERRSSERLVSQSVAKLPATNPNLLQVDMRLVPVLALLYLMAHIDRANIGNAKIEGMVKDLGMTGVQYNTVLSICS